MASRYAFVTGGAAHVPYTALRLRGVGVKAGQGLARHGNFGSAGPRGYAVVGAAAALPFCARTKCLDIVVGGALSVSSVAGRAAHEMGSTMGVSWSVCRSHSTTPSRKVTKPPSPEIACLRSSLASTSTTHPRPRYAFSRSYATNPSRSRTDTLGPVDAPSSKPASTPSSPHSSSITESSYARPASELSQNVTDEEKSHYDRTVEHTKEAQLRSPWLREGADVPPVLKGPNAGDESGSKDAKTMRSSVSAQAGRGKLLTTPSRMLKLILPLQPVNAGQTSGPVRDDDTQASPNDGALEIEPLALLVHPQQPLSYLERLIQSELPPIKDKAGNEKIPGVTFRAEDPGDDEEGKRAERGRLGGRKKKHDEDDEESEYMKINGKMEKTGKLNRTSKRDDESSGASGKDAAATSTSNGSSNGNDIPELRGRNFIRWSPSTEIGDFIRDASLGNVFTVTIEGAPAPVVINVPSFADRTFYLRMRLRKVARRISDMAGVKAECDKLAHKSAQRVAQAGFAGLVGWWYLVYRLTFETDLGWDYMEPITYLMGLSTIIGGYCWFLYHNREVSYRAALNLTISKRQSKLYDLKGFDLRRWEGLVDEGNRLRREIRMVAEEYDTEWDEKEEGGEDVKEALREERKKEKSGEKEDKKQEDESGG